MRQLFKISKIYLFISIIILTLYVDFSVKAADGVFSGYAWSENAGWINFSPPGGGVTVDTSGYLKGYAWGENLGWISFNCTDANYCGTSDYKVNISPFPLTVIGGGGGGGSCPVCSSTGQDTNPPIISNINIENSEYRTVLVKWNTDEKTDSVVEYGLDTSYNYLAGNTADISTPAVSHNVNVFNLSADTEYHFRIISRDISGNLKKSDDLILRTSPATKEDKAKENDKLKIAEQVIYELVSQGAIGDADLKDMIERVSSKPVILTDEANIKDISRSSARVLWQTDKETSSLVSFRLADNLKSEWREIGITNVYSVDHGVTLEGLMPGTSYQYQAKSIDILGNIILSKIGVFTTKSNAEVSDVKVSDITLNSAAISWITTVLTTSEVDYGIGIDYGMYASTRGSDKVTMHEVRLNRLSSGITYHFRVKGTDTDGDPLISDDYAFTTNALPAILNYSVESVNDSKAVIKWISNIDIDSLVSYENLRTSETRTQGDTKLIKDHRLELINLDPGTNYVFKIEGSDSLGNRIKSPEIKITTRLDTIPPGIMSVRTYSTIMQSKNSQAVISWKTDEPSTSQVFLYNVASKAVPVFTSNFDSNLTTNHTVLFTDLAPGVAYRFNIQSKDKSGNTAVSDDFSVLMPSVRKSIIQMLVEILEKIFGWTKKITL